MFQTHENGRRKGFFTELGEQYWDFVGLPINRPWFHVTYSMTSEEGIVLYQSIMLSNVDQILDLGRAENATIKFVDIVSPGYINKTERWKMEPLREIWIRVDKAFPDQYEQVYVLENGDSYTDMAVPPEDKACINEKIFSI